MANGAKPWIASIPGSRSLKHLKDNIGAADVEYTSEEMAVINKNCQKSFLRGERYPEELAKRVGR